METGDGSPKAKKGKAGIYSFLDSSFPLRTLRLCGKEYALLIFLYFFTRLYALTLFPIFSDESIYIHLAEKIVDDPLHLMFIRMEGKNPLFYWLNALTLNVFANPLVAGRVVSIFAGFASLAGIYLIGKKLYSEKHGLVAALFYIFCPYTLYFDRLALVDSLLCACGVWMIFAATRIADTARPGNLQGYKEFIFLGFIMALALFTKGTAILLLPLPVLILCLFGCHKEDAFWKKIILCLVIACLPLVLLYFFGKNVGYFERTDFFQIPNRLALTPEEILSFPWDIWRRNLGITAEFIVTYLTLPVIALVLFGFLFAFRGKKSAALVLWAAFTILAINAVARGFYSRYFLVAAPPMILLAATAALRLVDFLRIRLKQFPSYAVTAVFLAIILSDGFFLPKICSMTL